LVFDGTPRDLFEDHERLQEFQLGRPDISYVIDGLCQSLGIDAPKNVITLEDAVHYLLETS